jgi:uncharacterized protein (DUF952 family)
MSNIYHLTTPDEWNASSGLPFRTASLAQEGFVHCSYRPQVLKVANAFLREAPALIAVEIAADRLSARCVDEDPGIGELFPHVYGPIDRSAVHNVIPLVRDAAGSWTWPNQARADEPQASR